MCHKDMTEWQKEALIERYSRSMYKANWRELPNNRFPPVWANTSENVKDFVRNQARKAIEDETKFEEEMIEGGHDGRSDCEDSSQGER